jgi:hypothetical protein
VRKFAGVNMFKSINLNIGLHFNHIYIYTYMSV